MYQKFFFLCSGSLATELYPTFPFSQSPKEVLGSKVDPQIQDNVTRTPSE